MKVLGEMTIKIKPQVATLVVTETKKPFPASDPLMRAKLLKQKHFEYQPEGSVPALKGHCDKNAT